MMAQGTLERDRAWAVRSSIDRTIQRIERLVDFETEALRTRAAIDLRETNNRKSQALLELDMIARALDGAHLDPDIIARLKALRGKLEANRIMLNRHLEAVREVACIVADTIRDSEWDGTYSEFDASGGTAR